MAQLSLSVLLSSSSSCSPSSSAFYSFSASSSSLLSLSFFLFLLFCPIVINGLNIYVKPNDEECFYEYLSIGEKMLASYTVQTGGNLDIDVKVYGPDLGIVYEIERSREGNFQFKAILVGSHKFCFINTMSLVSGKTISFNSYTGHSLLSLDAAKTEHLTPLEQAIISTSENLNNLHDTQIYLKYRDNRHAETVESTNSRVVWWSLLELTGLVAISVFNIVFLRQLFERSGKR